MFEKGLFNGLFDLNGDGKMDDMERALELATFIDFIESQEENADSDNNDF